MFAGGAGLLVWSGVLSYEREPTREEVSMFRWINGRTGALARPIWVVMLAGTFGAVPVSAAAALIAKRRRLAVHLAVGGTGAYVLAKAVKPLVGRGRPGLLLERVAFRDQIGGDRGWVSGHTAVATSLALVAGPSSPPWLRVGSYLVATAVGAGRMYAGAHMPLDVAGGAGLGMMIAAVMEPA